MIIARLQKLMAEEKLFIFRELRVLIRTSTVFTTHTPVIAGNEHFDTKLAKKYLEPEIKQIGLSFDEFMRLRIYRKQQGCLLDGRACR